ncbi:F-type H+-transporting ATPase subunit b [Breznakibacter xylanolyticus]|uniref:ATP synthase subunit b n=1 Tax=Breznakibacter xylanolyticus TaxID=990 RepID=A0A2W7NTU9_9BACT|nr:F0F1 ATP synthase subunit B [Breznakibacter xylanolyticus]PZX16756.1 F-type H+-transporting ATPase subunit b [Breznakibacter xylanolyticus]
MNLLTPEPGLLIWSSVSFLILLFLLTKYAWKPIIHALRVREETIAYSLREAERARQEMVNIEKTQKQILDQARVERDEMIKEAKEIRDKLVMEARDVAKLEAQKILSAAKSQLEQDKRAAIEDLKKQVALLSVDIASRLLQQELSDPEKQKGLIKNYLNEATFN